MKTNAIILALATSIAAISLTTAAVASPRAVPATMTDIDIPTDLDNHSLPNDSNGPCSHCRVFPLKSSSSTGYEDAAFDLYFADDGDDLSADIEVRVLLDSNVYRTVTLYGVELIDETTDNHEVESGTDWDWTDAVSATVEVIPLP